MPRLIFKNNFEVALAQPTTTSDTTITIRSGSGFPTLAANERVVATIVDAATGLQFEIVTVTAVVGNVLTVQRAQEGTAAREWAAGDMLSIRTTAATLTNSFRNFGEIPSGINLNALTGTWFGIYYQTQDSNASTTLNYPIAVGGSLEVFTSGAGQEGCIQVYKVRNSARSYTRTYNPQSGWTSWNSYRMTDDTVPIQFGGTGQTTIQGMKTAFGFGQVADQDIVPTSMGGTGSGDNAQAWLNIRPTGSTPLAGDPVNDYDAATKRWVENLVNTGTVGPSMNGVMNYGVGDFHLRDSRAYIQPYEVVSDGQLLNRADWPELWAYAQMLSPIADADWLADASKRGKYSLGNGTTTFRVPDRNGVQAGSVPGLFGRGDGGVSSFDGRVRQNAAPNISGSPNVSMLTAFSTAGEIRGYGAFEPKKVTAAGNMRGTSSGYYVDVTFDASLSNSAYGRDGSAEVRPNAFEGVWVIRASGGFVAANTQWSVITGDSSRPSTGVTTDGGEIISRYNIGTAQEAQMSWRVRALIGGTYYARLNVSNATKGTTTVFDFDDTGAMSAPGPISAGAAGSNFKSTIEVNNVSYPGLLFKPTYTNGNVIPDTVVGGNTFFECSFIQGQISGVQLYRRRKDGIATGQIAISFPTTAGTLALQGTSGIEYKKDVVDADAKEAMDRINSQRLVNFVYKDDEQERVRFGIIAEEAELIAPQYIKHNQENVSDILDEEGNKIGEETRDRPSVDTNPIVMDLMGCVQYLNKQIEDLKAEIAALKAEK